MCVCVCVCVCGLYMFGTVPLSIIRIHPDPARKLSVNLYDIHNCCVYGEKTPDDGQRNCPKHIEFYSKINLRNQYI